MENIKRRVINEIGEKINDYCERTDVSTLIQKLGKTLFDFYITDFIDAKQQFVTQILCILNMMFY